MITNNIIKYIAQKPYSPAKEIIEIFSLNNRSLMKVFEQIKTSKNIQNKLLSINEDYFRIIYKYFRKNSFEITFFPGTYCEYSCNFCPNVSLSKNDNRFKSKYFSKKFSKINFDKVEELFDQMLLIKKRGKNISVKISGGLEPLSNIELVDFILELSNSYSIYSHIYTNGYLLKDKNIRDVALKSNEIRISLNYLTNQDYLNICFGKNCKNMNLFSFELVKENIRSLTEEKNKLNKNTKIGINSIILKLENDYLINLAKLSSYLNVDYIIFKPNYTVRYDSKQLRDIMYQKQSILQLKNSGDLNKLEVFFPSSLNPNNIFFSKPIGYCSPETHLRFKIVIDPFGNCFPLHINAYPNGKEIEYNNSSFYLGNINDNFKLNDIYTKNFKFKPVNYTILNPLEFLLSLEINRQKSNDAFGLLNPTDPFLFEFN